MSFNFLPTPVVQSSILPRFEISDLLRFGQIDKKSQREALADQVWKKLAEDCGFANAPTTNIRQYVFQTVKDLQKQIREIEFKKNEIPKEITDVANATSPPTVAQIHLMQEFLKVRDLIIFWDALAEGINEKLSKTDPLSNLGEIRDNFAVWYGFVA